VGEVSPTFSFFGVFLDRHELEQQMEGRLKALGFELVDLRHGGSARRPHLSVRIDWAEAVPGRTVTVDDCAVVSRALEAWLDTTGVGEGRYILEVSSPGMDRPLRRLEEWRRFTGRKVDVLVPQWGGRFTVTHIGVVDGPLPLVELEMPKGERRTIQLSDIKEARLAIDW
jgi:ribosome maturation factor RimP